MDSGKCFVAKLLQMRFMESSGVNCMQPYMFANIFAVWPHLPVAKLSHRINFKSVQENEAHYRHLILFALYSKLKAIDGLFCSLSATPRIEWG